MSSIDRRGVKGELAGGPDSEEQEQGPGSDPLLPAQTQPAASNDAQADAAVVAAAANLHLHPLLHHHHYHQPPRLMSSTMSLGAGTAGKVLLFRGLRLKVRA
jgi:hypothetical protein